MSKRGAKSAPITKPTSIIPAKWLAIHPVENHAKLQADVNRLMVAECKLEKNRSWRRPKPGRSHCPRRDHLANARVLLILLSPTITFFRSSATSSREWWELLLCFTFLYANRSICLHLPKQSQEWRDAHPMLGCSRGRLQYGMFEWEQHMISH